MLKGWHNILVMDSRGLSFIMRFHSDNGAITKQSLSCILFVFCDRNAAITTGSPAMLFPPSVILALSAASTKNTPLGYELERRYRAVAELPADVSLEKIRYNATSNIHIMIFFLYGYSLALLLRTLSCV